MANQPQNPQQQNQQQRGDRPAKHASGQQAKPGAGRADQDRPGTRPQDPADLGHDPQPDDVQAGRMGESNEKNRH